MKKVYILMEYYKKKLCMHHWSPRRRREEKAVESLFKEITAENFLNLGRDLDIQVHELIGKLIISIHNNFHQNI